jgi:Ala-tRNA(Pro) deacylase
MSGQDALAWRVSGVPWEVVSVSVVTDLLDKRGVTFEVIPHDQAYTSIDEATALGIRQMRFSRPSCWIPHQDTRLRWFPGHAASTCGAWRRPSEPSTSEEEIEKSFPGYELGALPPIGSLFGIQTFVDPDVMEHDTVVFAAGSQMESMKLRTDDLFRDEPVTIAPLNRYSATGEEAHDEG